MNFAGHIVSGDGVRPHPDRVKAIADFPVPKDVKDVRSFLGMANQLGRFLPDLAQASAELRTLLKKDRAFHWLPEHQASFEVTKGLLMSPALVKHFDKTLPTELLTDRSRLHGMGFALLQRDSRGLPRLICCGSKSFTDTESRYATIELEARAVQCLVQKSKYYLHGHQGFKVVTDHRPLVGIFNKPLEAIHNIRLQRMRESLTDYRFQILWTPGKQHDIADALSRAPVFSQERTQVKRVMSFEDPNI